MLMWGSCSFYLVDQAERSPLQAGGAFIGAVLLWDILFRGQIGFSISFLEEMWSRNLGNLMMTPLRPAELVVAQMVMSIIRVMIGFVPVTIMAIIFFGFNFWGLGLALVAFFLNLILTSWSIGLVASGMVLKKGLGAEGLAWSLTFLLLPLCCVYYPVSIFPVWLQWIALALPADPCLRGDARPRSGTSLRCGRMAVALALNVVYFAAAATAFGLLLRSARQERRAAATGE